MKKYLSLTLIVLLSSVLFLVACDKYANINIVADKAELQFVLDENNFAENQLFSAEVTGGGDILRSLSARSEPAGVVTTAIRYQNGKNIVTVTPMSGGVTDIYLKMIDGGFEKKVTRVNVVKPIKTLSTSDTPLSIPLGSSLVLDEKGVVFGPVDTTQRGMDYALKMPYAGLSFSSSNVLAAASNASVGLATIIVRSKTITLDMTAEEIEALTTELRVLIYRPLLESDIRLNARAKSDPTGTGSEVSQIVLAKNTDYQNELELDVFFSPDRTDIKVSAFAQNARTAFSERMHDNNDRSYNISSVERGETNFVVSVSIVYDNIVYVVVTRDFKVVVIDAVERVNLTTLDGTVSSLPVELNAYVVYSGILGTQLTVNPAPESATNKNFIVNLVKIDGSAVPNPAGLGVKVLREAIGYPNGRAVELGVDVLPAGTNLFISVDSSFSGENFLLEFVSNLSLPGHEVTNYATFNVVAGVEGMDTSVPLDVGAEVQTELEFTINYSTSESASNNSTDGLQMFILTLNDPTLAQIVNVSTGKYKLIGRNPGKTTLRIMSGNGYTKNFDVFVLVEATAAGLSVPRLGLDGVVSSQQYPSDTVDANGIINYGISRADIEINNSFTANLLMSPANANVFNLFYQSSHTYVTVVPSTGRINLYGECAVTITASFEVVKLVGGVWQRVSMTREIMINAFRPIDTFTIQQQTSSLLYDINSLYFGDAYRASAEITAQVLPANSTLGASSIVWQSSNPIVSVHSVSAGKIRVTADLLGYTYTSQIVVYITGTIYEYGRSRTVTAFVTVVKPARVTEITVDEYFDELGIYLEDREQSGAINRGEFEVNADVQPTGALDKRITYIVYHAQLNEVTGTVEPLGIYQNGDAYAILEYEFNAELGLPILPVGSNGKPLVKPRKGYSGYFMIYAVPLDQLNSPITIQEPFAIGNVGVYLPMWGGIADGITVPYRIFTAQDLMNISTTELNLAARYDLMNDIDLYGIANWQPLGRLPDGRVLGFSGSLTSFISRLSPVASRIVGLRLNTKSLAIVGDAAYMGLFAKLDNGARISNIVVDCVECNINIDSLTPAQQTQINKIYAGTLAGMSISGISVDAFDGRTQNGFIESVTANTMRNDVNLANLINASTWTGELYIGGIVGSLGYAAANGGIKAQYGVIYSSTAVFDLDVDAPNANLYLGGLVGISNGIIGVNNSEQAIAPIARDSYNFAEVKFNVIHTGMGGVIEAGAALTSYIGGIAGLNAGATIAVNDVRKLEYARASGNIYARGNDNIGGITGENRIRPIGYVTSSVRLSGLNNIGGIAGLNSGNISNAIYEAYDYISLEKEKASAIVARGQNVGGLIGVSTNGNVDFSFAISYVVRTIVDYTIDISGSSQYYGDILSLSTSLARVGGLVGSLRDTTINSSFANMHMQAVSSSASVGGAVGWFDLSTDAVQKVISNEFHTDDMTPLGLVNNMFVRGSIVAHVGASEGALIGYVNAESSAVTFIYYTYASMDGLEVFVGGSNIAASYAIHSFFEVSLTSTTSFGAVGATSESLKYMGLEDEHGVIFYTGWLYQTLFVLGQQEVEDRNNVFWAYYTDSVDINENYPVLLNKTRDGLLVNIIPESIGVSLKDESMLPEGQREVSKYAKEQAADKFVLIWDLLPRYDIKLGDLFDLAVEPLASMDDLVVSITSSNTSVIDIVPGVTPQKYSLTIKALGTTTITIQALRNLAAKAVFQINIVRGMDDFKIYNSRDFERPLGGLDAENITNGYYPQPDHQSNQVSVGRGNAGLVAPVAYANNNIVHMDGAGVTYVVENGGTNPSDYMFFGAHDSWTPSATYMQTLGLTSDNVHLLTGVQSTSMLEITQTIGGTIYGAILVKAIPYILTQFEEDDGFGGVILTTTRFELSDLTWWFFVRIYEGVSSVELDKESLGLEPENDLSLTVTITTDDAIKFRDDIATNFELTETVDGVLSPILTIAPDDLSNIKDNTQMVPYSSYLSYHVDSISILYDTGRPYAVELKLLININNKRITKAQHFKLNFVAKDAVGQEEAQLEITYSPQSVKRIEADFYYNGASAYNEYADPSNEIASGKQGLLVLNVDPFYSDFDYLLVSSTALGSGERISFMHQAIYTVDDSKIAFKDIYPLAQIDQDTGEINIRKLNTYNGGNNFSYNNTGAATFYISTLLASGIPEKTPFTITIKAMKAGKEQPEFTRKLDLITRFSPYVTVEIKKAVPNAIANVDNAVARGTEVEFDITAWSLNSRLEISTGYNPVDVTAENKFKQISLSQVPGNPFMTKIPTEVRSSIKIYFGLLAAGPIDIDFVLTSTSPLGTEVYRRTLTVIVVDFVVNTISADGVENNSKLVGIKDPGERLAVTWDLLSAANGGTGVNRIGYKLAQSNMLLDDATDIDICNNALNAIENAVITALNEMNRAEFKSPDGSTDIGGALGGIWSVRNGGSNSQYIALQAGMTSISEITVRYSSSGFWVVGKTISDNVQIKANIYYRYELINSVYVFKFSLTNDFEYSPGASQAINASTDFSLRIRELTDEENPLPIETEADFLAMQPGLDYILHNNLEFDSYTPLSTEIASLDGNGYKIAINSFNFARRDENNNLMGTVNVGLFGTLTSATTLKNVIIDVANLTAPVDVTGVMIVNFGLIAGHNVGGRIYNCEVITTRTQAQYYYAAGASTSGSITVDNEYGQRTFDSLREDYLINQGDYDSGRKPAPTLQSVRVDTSRFVSNTAVSVRMGGLVGYNEGYITNSRVGRVSYSIDYNLVTGKTNKTYNEDAIGRGFDVVQGVNLFGNGKLGGVVGWNFGIISSCYYANGLIVSSSLEDSTNSLAGGLVGENADGARISGSYAMGNANSIYMLSDDAVPSSESSEDRDRRVNAGRALTGGVTGYGTVGGLVHTNRGIVENSYANMNLVSSTGTGGFVFSNLATGNIENSYSLSKLASEAYNSGVFTGMDRAFTIQNTGVIIRSYYLDPAGSSVVVSEDEPAVGLDYGMFNQASLGAFVGFVFEHPEVDVDGAIWWDAETRPQNNIKFLGPQLTAANDIAWSQRNREFEYVQGTPRYGDEKNPVLIRDITSFNNVFKYEAGNGDSLASRYVFYDGAEYRLVEGTHIRFISDINFITAQSQTPILQQAQPRQTPNIAVIGSKIDGNSMTLSNINRAISEVLNSSGLFKRIERSVVTNLGLDITEFSAAQVKAVGGLAGTIEDSSVTNIRLSTSNEHGGVSGFNMVGGLAGLVTGRSQVENIKSSVSVTASYRPSDASGKTNYYYDRAEAYYRYSYSGGVIGVLDLDIVVEAEYSDEARIEAESVYFNNPSVKNLIVSGRVLISGENAGGVVGLTTAYSCVAESAFIVINDEFARAQTLDGPNFVGGIVGVNMGEIRTSFIGFALEEQRAWDKTITTGNANTKTGPMSLFTGASTAIGGIAGLNLVGGIAESGGDQWYRAYGRITDCYSRVAVYNTAATAAGGIVGMTSVLNAFMERVDEVGTGATNILKGIMSISRVPDRPSDEYAYTGEIASVDRPSAYITQVYSTSTVYAAKFVGGLAGFVGNGPIELDKATLVNNFDTLAYEKAKAGATSLGSAIGFINFAEEREGGIRQAFIKIDAEESEIFNFADDLFVTPVLRRDASNLYLNEIGNAPAFVPQGTSQYAIQQTVLEPINVSFVTAATSPNLTPYPFNFTDIWNIDKDLVDLVFPELALGKVSSIIIIKNVDELKAVMNKPTGMYHVLVPESDNLDNILEINPGDGVDGVWKSLGSNIVGFRGTLNGRANSLGKFPTILIKDADAYNSLFYRLTNANLMNLTIEFDGTADLKVEGAMSGTQIVEGRFGFIARVAQNCSFENINIIVPNRELAVNYLQMFGGIAGESTSNRYTNCSVDIKIKSIDVGFSGYGTENPRKTESYFGGLFGYDNATGLQIIRQTQGQAGQIKMSAALKVVSEETQLYIGGIAGSVNGLRADAVDYNTDNISVEVLYRLDTTNHVFAGGLFGHARGNPTGSIKGFTISAGINVVHSGKIDNYADPIAYIGGVAGCVGSVSGGASGLNISDIKVSTPAPSSGVPDENEITALQTGDLLGTKQAYRAYVGGLVGKYSTFITSGGLPATTVSNIVTDVNIIVRVSRQAYVGGIFGEVVSEVKYSVMKTPKNVFDKLLSLGNIDVMGVAIDIGADDTHVGGIAGSTKYNVFSAGNAEPAEAAYDILKFSECASIGKINIDGFMKVRAGGLFGRAGMAIIDSFSVSDVVVELIKAAETEKNTLYLGGIAGYLRASVDNSYTAGIVNQRASNFISVGAVVGEKLPSAVLSSVFFADDLSMLSDSLSAESNSGVINLSNTISRIDNKDVRLYANAMLDSNNFAVNGVGLSFASDGQWKTGAGGSKTYPYLKWTEQHISTALEARGKLRPTIISSEGDLNAINNDPTNLYNVVFLNADLSVDPGNMNTNYVRDVWQLANISRFIGCGHSITVNATSSTSVSSSGNFGIFSEIPVGTAVSGLRVFAQELNVTYSNAGLLNFGVLAGVNNGLVYNCITGSHPNAVSTGAPEEAYGSSDTENLSKIEYTISQNTAKVNMGGLIGLNTGYILSSSGFVEIVAALPASGTYKHSLGVLVGKSELKGGAGGSEHKPAVKDSYTNGSVHTNVAFSANNIVSGVVGYASDTNLYRLFGYSAVSADSSPQVQYMSSVVVLESATSCDTQFLFGNRTMSNELGTKYQGYNNTNNHDKYVDYNDIKAYMDGIVGLNSTVKVQLVASEIDVTANSYTAAWLQSNETNYMLPYLSCASEGLYTGTGSGDASKAYHIWHEKQFWMMQAGGYPSASFLITNNITLRGKWVPNIDFQGQLYGGSKTITLEHTYKLSDNGQVAYWGLFRKVSGEIHHLNVSAGDLSLNVTNATEEASITQHLFGGIAAIYGTSAKINNCTFTAGTITYTQTKQVIYGGIFARSESDSTGGIKIFQSYTNVAQVILGSTSNNLGSSTAGGLVGTLSGGSTVEQCFSEDNITLRIASGATAKLGGIVGHAYGTITIRDSYTYGGSLIVKRSSSAPIVYLGSLVGHIEGASINLQYCYSYNYVMVDSLASGGVNFGLIWGNRVTGGSRNSLLTALYAPNSSNATSPVVTNVHDYYQFASYSNNLPLSGMLNSGIGSLRGGSIGDSTYSNWSNTIWNKGTDYIAYLINVTPESMREPRDIGSFTFGTDNMGRIDGGRLEFV